MDLSSKDSDPREIYRTEVSRWFKDLPATNLWTMSNGLTRLSKKFQDLSEHLELMTLLELLLSNQGISTHPSPMLFQSPISH